MVNNQCKMKKKNLNACKYWVLINSNTWLNINNQKDKFNKKNVLKGHC